MQVLRTMWIVESAVGICHNSEVLLRFHLLPCAQMCDSECEDERESMAPSTVHTGVSCPPSKKAKTTAARSVHEEAPAPPDTVDLPDTYKAKKCKYCRCWSTELCKWNLSNTVLASWIVLLPWARGAVTKPIGDLCKICAIVSWLECDHLILYTAYSYHICYFVHQRSGPRAAMKPTMSLMPNFKQLLHRIQLCFTRFLRLGHWRQ